jgi:hypothetical protein
MAKTPMTREEEIQATMKLFNCGRFHAEELVAMEHGESSGDCVAVDKTGREISLKAALERKKTAA